MQGTLPDLMNSVWGERSLKETLDNTLPHVEWVANACTLFS